MQPFHLAFPVSDLQKTRDFYVNVLGCREGRSDEHWIDFDLFGHQVVAHQSSSVNHVVTRNAVDGDSVPVPHFGVVLERQQWDELATRVRAAGIEFIIEPHVRFEGQVGEQATMFFMDPSGNALEFKSFQNMGQLFAK